MHGESQYNSAFSNSDLEYITRVTFFQGKVVLEGTLLNTTTMQYLIRNAIIIFQSNNSERLLAVAARSVT